VAVVFHELDLVGFTTHPYRLRAEAVAANATIVTPPFIGAWTTVW
jgi:hypothetical protein